MRDQTVAICDMSSSAVYRETPFRLKKDPKRFRWLTTLMWWTLGKLNALEPFLEKIETWTYTPQKAEPINKALEGSLTGILRAGRSIDDFAFVMGAKEFQELTACSSFREEMTFNTGEFRWNDGYRCRRFGVPIHVVPTLSGIAAIPKVVIETKRGR